MRQAVPPRRRTFARKMRADSTKAENVLWQALRNKQLGGLKFKRQVPLDGYILDFVCFEARLIVEVDGGQRSESSRDAVRDRHLPARFSRYERRCGEKHRRRVLRDFAGSQGPAAGPVTPRRLLSQTPMPALSPLGGENGFSRS
jgi:very-short-patch-repair endonuclease